MVFVLLLPVTADARGSGMTPNLETVVEYVRAEYGLHVGITNCRRISGSRTWSQHSWSNAGDIYVSNKALGDKIYWDLYDKFGENIRYMLWQRKDHYNHIHVDMWPYGYGTPPCAGGHLQVKNKDGTISHGFSSDFEGGFEVTALQVVQLQVALNKADQLGADGNALDEDDVWGPNSEFALVNGLTALVATGGLTEGEVKALIAGTTLVPDETPQ